MIRLICTHLVTKAELTLTATPNVLCNVRALSSDDDINERLLESTDIKIKCNTSTFIFIGIEFLSSANGGRWVLATNQKLEKFVFERLR